MTPDLRARLHDIRAGLPGQLRRERLETAALLYGPLASLEDLRLRIARTLPRRFGSVRWVKIVPITQCEAAIPEEVLLEYDDARQLGVFSRFLVATPAYYCRPQAPPWLVAEIEGTERWAVIARWPDEARRAA